MLKETEVTFWMVSQEPTKMLNTVSSSNKFNMMKMVSHSTLRRRNLKREKKRLSKTTLKIKTSSHLAVLCLRAKTKT